MKISAYLAISVTLFFSVTTAFAQNCPLGVRYRKEIRNLTDDERNRFIAAVKKLQTPQPGSGVSKYDQLVKIHIDAAYETHNAAMYFPFHRAFLLEFERELQKIDPTVMLPYWDWSLDSQAPEHSPIFSANFMGGNGGPGTCVANGAFAPWRPSYPAPHCLRRQFNAGNWINPFYSNEAIIQIISQATSYDALRRAIEYAPAGSVHVGIGGDMATMQAPNDPIYWLHIAYVDRIWRRWQQMRPEFANSVNGTLWSGAPIQTTTLIPGLKTFYRVGDVLDTKKLCYDYAELRPAWFTSKPLQ